MVKALLNPWFILEQKNTLIPSLPVLLGLGGLSTPAPGHSFTPRAGLCQSKWIIDQFAA